MVLSWLGLVHFVIATTESNINYPKTNCRNTITLQTYVHSCRYKCANSFIVYVCECLGGESYVNRKNMGRRNS